MRKNLPCLSRVKNYHQMAITCRASTEHPEMPQVVLLLKMPCAAHLEQEHKQPTIHDPLRSPSHEQDPRKRNAPISRVLRATPPRLYSMSGTIYLPTQRNRRTARPTPRPTPTAPRRANSRGRRENPLPAVCINSLEVHRGRVSPRPHQRLAYRENISLQLPGRTTWRQLVRTSVVKLYQQGERT